MVEQRAPSSAAEPSTGPAPQARHGTALCLSGGGFRASLFHLGSLRRLNELGVLGSVDTLSVVSGGAILAAHLVRAIAAWPRPGETLPDWEATVAAPFRAFASRDIRTWPIVKRVLLPWCWMRSTTQVETMVTTYAKLLNGDALSALPERPDLVLCATDMVYGVNWECRRGQIGDYQAGYGPPSQVWSVARAAAASSCFPPIFGPMRLHMDPQELRGGMYRGTDRDELARSIRLTDGGVYDNMGLEPVWKSHATVLVSDGGAVFQPGGQGSPAKRIMRYPAIVDRQSRALRKRWLISRLNAEEFRGAYWGISSATSSYPGAAVGGYSKDLAKSVIACIRTDLDAFGPAEAAVLENHGYLLAQAAIERHLPGMSAGAPLSLPHPQWIDEAKVRRALAGSHRRRWRGRGRIAGFF